MNKKLLCAALAALAVMPSIAKKKEPVVMTVNGKDVPLSEFRYLYEKNNAQQQTPVTPQDYLDMFITYKLKVADAEANGIDTTQAFIKEYNTYRKDLFRPYLENPTVEERLINEEYDRMHYEVDCSHIMLAPGKTLQEREANKAMLDSIRNEILAGADFAEMARKYTFDGSTRNNGGHMGYIPAGRFPYAFEKVVWETPEGEVSEVFDSGFGFHIVKVNGRQPNQGEVLARHILKLTQGKTPEMAERAHVKIDSIYTAIIEGADFAEMAQLESEDYGTAQKGGELPWFGHGMMVPEFEQTAFSLADSTFSEPFATSYGYHIVYRIGHRDLLPLDELRDGIKAQISRDSRAQEPRKEKFAELRATYNTKTNDTNVETIRMAIQKAEQLDSALADIFIFQPITLATVGNVEITSADVLNNINLSKPMPGIQAMEAFDNALEDVIDNKVTDLEMTRLEEVDPDFRNLIHEYHDGMLLFEVSNRRVWDAAARDIEGRKAFFEANRDNYKWEKPKFKGTIILSDKESTLEEIKALIEKEHVAADTLGRTLRKQFGRNVRIERVLAEEGENKKVDYAVFGHGMQLDPKDRFIYMHVYDGKLLDEPESMADVKGQVISDYQAKLEKEWLDEIHEKYPVKVNKGVLKKVK